MRGKVCVECQVDLLPEKNDVAAVLMTKDNEPTAVWSADLWQCPSCGHRVLLGFGQRPVAEDDRPDRLRSMIRSYRQHVYRFWSSLQHKERAA